MVALLYYLAVGQNYDLIRVLNGRQTVSNYKHCTDVHHFFKRILNEKLGFGINISGCLVKYHNRRLMHDGSCEGKQLTLSCGEVITERARLGISFAFQQPVRFKGITVKDLISLAAGKNTNVSDACKYLSEVGLCAKDYINREVNASLSGGELKRIEIAMINARGTKLSVFDEPEAGIDLWSFNNLIKVFEDMHERTKGNIVIISHQERILDIADKIMLVSGGTVADYGNKDDILPKLLDVKSGCKFTKGGV